ncbi:MAG: DUF3788 domain-containing protein [Terracidiphilus sp.]
MDIPNAFIGQLDAPTPAEVSSALGPADELWKHLVAWASELKIVEQEWKCSGKKYGWSFKLKVKKRNIIHMSPCEGCFRVAFIFGDKTMAAARQSDLAGSTLKLMDEAPRYPEGTGLRLMVRSVNDLVEIRKLALIKLAN